MSTIIDLPLHGPFSRTSSNLTKNEAIAKSQEAYVIKKRRDLHQIPELAWEETKTMAYIYGEIKQIEQSSIHPLIIKEFEGGLVVDLNINPSFTTILFRADMDALPIQEETDLPFSSKHDGKMHACGHDCHMAMLLGAFRAICLGFLKPSINIRFVWQRAEEWVKTNSGGKILVEEGVCNDVHSVYGLHISPIDENGSFFSRPGIMMSNAACLNIEVQCSGGHVMHPEIGSNAIHILSDIHNSLRGFESLFCKPDEPIAFVPSVYQAGNVSNIRPSFGRLNYSFRNFLSVKERERFIGAVKRRVESIIEVYPTAFLKTFELDPGYPALTNHQQSYNLVKELLQEEPVAKTGDTKQLFSGEDFTFYLQKRLGCFWLLGAEKTGSSDYHSSTFNPDEKVFWKGVYYWLMLATTARHYAL